MLCLSDMYMFHFSSCFLYNRVRRCVVCEVRIWLHYGLSAPGSGWSRDTI